MKIKYVSAENFMNHEKLDITFPDKGLVLVTGHNGAGKSSIVEAVGFSFWGRTLRGSDPRNAVRNGFVVCDSDVLAVRRRWKAGGSAKLEVVGEKHETSTKAQQRVSDLLSWDVWRRSCAFSSADAAHFTLAADAERKRLLEAILGLDRLDAAYELARADLRSAEQKAASSRLVTARCQAALDVASDVHKKAVAAHTHRTRPSKSVCEAVAMVKDAESRVTKLTEELDSIRVEHSEARLVQSREENFYSQAIKRLTEIDRSECPTCSRPFDCDHELRAQIEAEVSAHEEASKVAVQLVKDLHQAGVKATMALKLAQAEEKRCISFESAVAKAWAEWDSGTQAIDEALERMSGLELDLVDAEVRLAEAEAEVGLLSACCAVLGTRGVRSHILASSLAYLETASNRWLAEIGDRDLKIQIRPQVERGSGAVSDVVSLEVIGAGGGHGYKAASAGERRRIDVAIMLGLAELAGRAHGTCASTLFFDEVFDALDADGARAVAYALGNLARSRCVVVISHSEALAQELNPELSIVVSQGKSTIRRVV